MNARTLRRAVERKARKQARKEESNATAAQLDANRSNSKLSTGPVSPQGKAIASRNALKTGLTGRTVLLPAEDAASYEHHVQTRFAELRPVGDRETELVQSIADSKWRLARIPGLEFGIYALGYRQFAEEFANIPAAEAGTLIEARTFMAYQRQLMNLSLQESRLRRQCDKDAAELKQLQHLRAQKERVKAKFAVAPAPAPHATLPEIGFEFSNGELDALEDHLGLDADLLPLSKAA